MTPNLALDELNGLNIVVTRPREQAVTLAQRIEHAGGKAVLFPLLEILPAANPLQLREMVARLHEFNLAIFISPNAVHYGMEAVRAAGALPESLKIATVGQGSAKALRAMGVKEVIVPQERFDSESLLALPALQNVTGWRVVIFRGDGGRELLGETLKARGAGVEYAECYQRVKPQQEVAVLFAADPHVITVTSSEALAYLWEMSDDLAKARLVAVPLFVPHARIANAARQLGWCNIIETEAGDDGLFSSLIAWAKNRRLAEH
jgi:uroporphyrinogen-III synthase